MDTTTLVQDPALRRPIGELADRIRRPEHAISDVIDAAGHQYVDLVMEGGGMLGIALVGYTWALEQMGIRFLGVGGTSAGSINALLLAGLGAPAEPKSPRLLEELAQQSFYDFVDGGEDVRRLIELALGPERRFKGLRLLFRLLRVKKRLASTYGLNPGDAFTRWLAGLLEAAGVATLDQLESRLATRPPGLAHREHGPFAEGEAPSGRLVIVAADITTETRVELPRMAALYWDAPGARSPAVLARASMAIPLFFEPLRVTGLPRDAAAARRWRAMAGYAVGEDPTAVIPETALLVDGGVMSNFPIDVFHKPGRVPRLPTFGVKLEYDARYKPPEKLPVHGNGRLRALAPLAGAVFNSARHTLDYEFIKRNPDYRHLLQHIPCTYRDAQGTTRSYDWLDFALPEEHKRGLFRQGAEKAIAFVDAFSGPVDERGERPGATSPERFPSRWAFYKDLRARLAQGRA